VRATAIAATGLMLCGCASPPQGPTPAEIEAAQLARIETAKRDARNVSRLARGTTMWPGPGATLISMIAKSSPVSAIPT
jgi:hypothetical protein